MNFRDAIFCDNYLKLEIKIGVKNAAWPSRINFFEEKSSLIEMAGDIRSLHKG